MRTYYTDPVYARGEISVSGVRDAFEYTLGLRNDVNHGAAGGGTTILAPDGSLHELRDDIWTSEYASPELNLRLGQLWADRVSSALSASHRRIEYDYRESGLRTGPDVPDPRRDVFVRQRGDEHELGGEHEFPLGAGRLKLIGLDRRENMTVEQRVLTNQLDGVVPGAGSRYHQDRTLRERIGRGEYRWRSGEADWQLSAEAAFNELQSAAELRVLDTQGVFVAVALHAATASVAEDRYEVMASYARALTPTLQLQVAGGAEHSALRQVGGGELTRSFLRPKGLLALSWRASPGFDVNATLQRRVGQLQFSNFLARVNLTDDRQNAGNPELVPQQSWELELEFARALGDWGSTTLVLHAQRSDDIVDIVPIGKTGESPGNLPRATRHGVDWRSTLNLDALGWHGARLDTRWQLWDSRVRDPLTGESRRISDTLIRQFSVALRHDVAATDFTWGASLDHEYRARDYRLTEVGRRWEGPLWGSLHVEHKNVFGLIVRATAGNLLAATSLWDRTVYEQRRTGPAAFSEHRDRRIGPVFSLSVAGRI